MWLLLLIAMSLTVLTYFVGIIYFVFISNPLCPKGKCLFGMNVVVASTTIPTIIILSSIDQHLHCA